MTRQTNSHRAQCVDCGRQLKPGEGVLTRVEGVDGYAWEARCLEGCRNLPELARWAVPATGRTHGGNQDSGMTLVDSAHRPPGGYPVNAAAHNACLSEPKSEPATARRWVAYWWLRNIVPRPKHVTIEQLDEMLGDADLEAMDAEVERARHDILRERGWT